MSTFDEGRARRYVLGQMSEDEVDALEAEYFDSSDTLERVWDVENDLVDAFVAGGLAPEERAAFEKHYLASPLHRDRVATARILREAAQGVAPLSSPRRMPTWPVWLTLAATVVLVIASLWLRQPPPETRPVAQGEVTPVPTPPTGASPETPPAPASVPKTTVAAFALSPMLMRSGQPTPVLRVPAGTDELAITLQGDPPEGIASGTSLPFTVTTVEGTRVATGHVRVEADGLGVARIAARGVPPGDYILAVGSARPSDGPLRQYFFRVTDWPGR